MDALFDTGYMQEFLTLLMQGRPALIIQLAILNTAALIAWLGWRSYYKRRMRRFTVRALQVLLAGINLILVINVSGDLAGLAELGKTWF